LKEKENITYSEGIKEKENITQSEDIENIKGIEDKEYNEGTKGRVKRVLNGQWSYNVVHSIKHNQFILSPNLFPSEQYYFKHQRMNEGYLFLKKLYCRRRFCNINNTFLR